MVTVLLSEPIHKEGIKLIEQHFTIKIAESTSEPVLVEAVKNVDAMIVRSSFISEEIIGAGKHLKVIGRHGIGVDNIDLKAATRCGVLVVNTPDANSISVAEHAVGSMLYLCKNFSRADAALRRGEFNQDGSLPGLVMKLGYSSVEMNGKTLGLIGFGRIARLLANICRLGFGMRVMAFDAYVNDSEMEKAGVEVCKSLDDVCRRSDFVSVHVPLTDGTRDLINKSLLCQMKAGAFFINTARGGVVNENDLYDALKNNQIAGAAVDIFEKEPPAPGHRFFELDNILVTPHMAAISDGGLKRMGMDVATGVIDFLQGRQPLYPVNPEVMANTLGIDK